jgi:predicted PurR-regulated permease PerM
MEKDKQKIREAFENKVWKMALTALSMAVIVVLSGSGVWLVLELIAYLQPILLPLAVAGVLAYLLEPVVRCFEKKGMKRQGVVILLFVGFGLILAGVSGYVTPKLFQQSGLLLGKAKHYTKVIRDKAVELDAKFVREYGIKVFSEDHEKEVKGTAMQVREGNGLEDLLHGDWVKNVLPTVGRSVWQFLKSSVGGFLGVFGLFFSMLIVPLYLYYFLMESRHIQDKWSDYLPLRSSEFKDELVSCLNEINTYLIAFFRGQVLVSFINGILTGIGLMALGLDFGLLFGLLLCVAGIIPYLGIAMCWLPAVIVAGCQTGSYLPEAWPWYALPIAVTVVFMVVQQVDGLVITPKVVGEAVGLHPMTVMASVFFWSLLLGGLLGAILAVPLSASVKVLFQRYIWQKKLQGLVG